MRLLTGYAVQATSDLFVDLIPENLHSDLMSHEKARETLVTQMMECPRRKYTLVRVMMEIHELDAETEELKREVMR